MECKCIDVKTHVDNVRTHRVIRDYLIAGRYERCGVCGRIEWLEITDALEFEINGTLGHCLRSGSDVLRKKGRPLPQEGFV